MPNERPLWIAQRHGQDWRDEHILSALAWMTAMVPAAAWQSRLDRVAATFDAAKIEWAASRRVPLFDPADLIAWYVFQANAYAADRTNWIEHAAYRIAPVFKRIGQDLALLDQIGGAQERVSRLMTSGRRQPDDGLYELLVALAYKRGGWTDVAFVPEQRGGSRTPDLSVSRTRQRWAVECKRVGQSGYAADERLKGEAMAKAVHELCRAVNRSLVIDVEFDDELVSLEDAYLADRIRGYFDDARATVWSDSAGRGQIREIDWRPMHMVLAHDDIYVGSSRMIELLVGHYVAQLDHSVDARWTPGPDRPFHATMMDQASVIRWVSASHAAARRKARHFRAMVADAAGQLPGDCPGAVHVGYEVLGGNSVEGFRHALNQMEMHDFDPGQSRLRWVYGNYMTPEHTTARNESSALSETTATYRIGGTRTQDPLPMHLLFSEGRGVPGWHWPQ